MNSICHQEGISFIRAETRGVFGTVFCDFGDDFEVHDVDGEISNTYQGLELNHKRLCRLRTSGDHYGILTMTKKVTDLVV